MEKTITIDGQEVRFKSTGATAIRYKKQFREDFFKEILKMGGLGKLTDLNDMDNVKPEDLDGLDFEVFYNLAWVFAKTADSTIPDPITWLDRFDEFPMVDIIPELYDLISSTLQSNKKK